MRFPVQALYVFFVALCPLSSPAVAQQGPMSVGVDKVRSEPLVQTIDVIGRFVPLQQGVIASRVQERVEAVMVEIGDRVAKGTVIARLSADRLQSQQAQWAAEVKAGEAQVVRGRATLAKAIQALKRQNRLKGSMAYRKDLVEDLERDVDVAQAQLASVEAGVARSNAQLQLAQIALRDTRVIAPYSGVVTVKHVSEGNYLRVGDAVVTLLNDANLEIEADVPSNRLAGLSTGARVSAVSNDGQEITAIVRAIVPSENSRTRTRAVRFLPEIASEPGEIAGNQSVTVRVPIGEPRPVITVHKDAVVVKGGKDIVYVVAEGKAMPRPVSLGDGVRDRREVLSGLQDGDVVVVRGNERLRPGQPVKALGS